MTALNIFRTAAQTCCWMIKAKPATTELNIDHCIRVARYYVVYKHVICGQHVECCNGNKCIVNGFFSFGLLLMQTPREWVDYVVVLTYVDFKPHSHREIVLAKADVWQWTSFAACEYSISMTWTQNILIPPQILFPSFPICMLQVTNLSHQHLHWWRKRLQPVYQICCHTKCEWVVHWI